MTTRLYFVETRYTVVESFRIEAETEREARLKAKSGDFDPYSSVKQSERISAAWPLANQSLAPTVAKTSTETPT